jgi:hypothetical protein
MGLPHGLGPISSKRSVTYVIARFGAQPSAVTAGRVAQLLADN